MVKKQSKDQRKDLKRLSSEADLPAVVVVALGDSTALDFSTLAGQRRVAEEVRLVRSALLYAGQVELVSPALLHLQKLIGLSRLGADGVIKLLEMHQREKGFDLVGRSQFEVEEILRVTRGWQPSRSSTRVHSDEAVQNFSKPRKSTTNILVRGTTRLLARCAGSMRNLGATMAGTILTKHWKAVC